MPNLQAAPGIADVIAQVIMACRQAVVLPLLTGQNAPNPSVPARQDKHAASQINGYTRHLEGHAPNQDRFAQLNLSRRDPIDPARSVGDCPGGRARCRSPTRAKLKQDDLCRRLANREVGTDDLESSGETPARRARTQPGIVDLAWELKNLRCKVEE